MRVSLVANARTLSIEGAHDAYLKWYDGWNADIGSVYKVAKDLPRGSLCIDAGANVGIMAISLAVQRPDFHIIAIEPVPSNATFLRRNIAANSITNVDVIEAALSDSSGSLPMTDNGPWSAVQAGQALHVRAIELDDLIDRAPAFVKIDTEGYEPYVFAGGRDLFIKHKPLVHAEFNTWFLLLHHFDPIQFASAIWTSFDVLETYYQENEDGAPKDPLSIVANNITRHGSVSDLLLRPRSPVPDVEMMIYSPDTLALRRQLRVRGADPLTV